MKLAIKGHYERDKEVIQLLETLGGVNVFNLEGSMNGYCYYINNSNIIYSCLSTCVENFIVYSIGEFEKKFPYKIGDKVIYEDKIREITKMVWEEQTNTIAYKLDDKLYCNVIDDLQPYKEETNMDYCPHNQPKSYAVGLKDNKATGSRIDFSLTERIELDLGDTHEVVVENGKTYVVKKKPTYPKTYEECCEVLGISRHDVEIDLPQPYQQKMFNLFKLHICRDAYWRLYGEEKGLGKSWEPDWREKRYIIYRNQDNIIGGCREAGFVEHHIFEFPIREMRDDFKENFNEEIEICKELL